MAIEDPPDEPVLPPTMTVPETNMTKSTRLWTCAWLCYVSLAAALGIGPARAADLAPGPGPGPGPEMVPAVEIAGPPYGYFSPVLDPRCRIVPMPQANLVGDTVRFRPTVVCQSRGMYEDSVLFP